VEVDIEGVLNTENSRSVLSTVHNQSTITLNMQAFMMQLDFCKHIRYSNRKQIEVLQTSNEFQDYLEPFYWWAWFGQHSSLCEDGFGIWI